MIVSLFNANSSIGNISSQIEQITALIIAPNQNSSQTQFTSTLTSEQLAEFQKIGIVEDTDLTSQIPKLDVYVERLFVPFDTQNTVDVSKKIPEKSVRIRIGDNADYAVSVCGAGQKSCSHNLTSRSAETFPIGVRYVRDNQVNSGSLILQSFADSSSYKGSYQNEPLVVSFQAI
jgi:hypothetical protein